VHFSADVKAGRFLVRIAQRPDETEPHVDLCYRGNLVPGAGLSIIFSLDQAYNVAKVLSRTDSPELAAAVTRCADLARNTDRFAVADGMAHGTLSLPDNVTYRQLDSWVRAGHIRADNPGSGHARVLEDGEDQVLKLMGDLVDAGITVVRAAELARKAHEIFTQYPDRSAAHLNWRGMTLMVGRPS
jgi:hypothetical protein